jgi:hypothetical protein
MEFKEKTDQLLPLFMGYAFVGFFLLCGIFVSGF